MRQVMFPINLEDAHIGACDLLDWSHLVLEAAHDEGGSGIAADILRQISANIAERAKHIELVSPLIDSVATAPTLAGVSGASMHDVALSLANRVRQVAWNALMKAMMSHGPDGLVLKKRPTWNDIGDRWPLVREELRQIPKFDLKSAREMVRDESRCATSVFAMPEGGSSPRPPWYTALGRLRDQFSDAAKQHPLISCQLVHAEETQKHYMPAHLEQPSSDTLESFGGVYRLGPTPCYDPHDLPFAVTLFENAGQAQLLLRTALRSVSFVSKGRMQNRRAADAAWSKYASAALQAGRCVREVPVMLLPHVSGQALSERDDARRWLWVVFDLAWHDRRGGLSVPRELVLRKGGGQMVFAYDLAFIRLFAEQHPEAGIPPEWCEKLPEYYESRLDDVFSASAAAIDLILANVDSYFAGVARELTGKMPPDSEANDTTAKTAHSPDFRSVKWFGNDFGFTANQAAVVRVLWHAWAQGTPDVGDETVLAAVDEQAPPARLNTLFRDHPAWGTMIVAGTTKGTHRLTELP
jgi:hypothetical protein